MDLLTALRYFGGAARSEELLARGVTRASIRAAFASGHIVRPASGTYALRRTPSAIVAAAALRGQIVCLSACAHWGLRLLERPRAAHIGVARNRSLAPTRLDHLGLRHVHHGAIHTPERRVEPLDAAVDHVAWCTTPLEQLVIVDAAMNSRQVDPLFGPTLSTGTRARHRWLIANMSTQSQSVPESVAHAVLNAAGWNPRVQVRYDNVGIVDFSVGTRHSIEVDGWEHHGTKEAFAEDRRRDREMTAKKKWTIRFTYADVVTDPHAFGLEVARVVGRRVSSRYDARMAWMSALPSTAFSRR